MKRIAQPEAVSRENPEERQIPLNPGAGYLHAVEGEKPSRSGDRMARCLSMTDLTPSERMVLARIAHYDGPGGAFPSHERIGAEIGRKRRQGGQHPAIHPAKGAGPMEADARPAGSEPI